jgi:hypothetical protein
LYTSYPTSSSISISSFSLYFTFSLLFLFVIIINIIIALDVMMLPLFVTFTGFLLPCLVADAVIL